MPVTSLDAVARAADALGLEREKKDGVLLVKLRWGTFLRCRTDGETVQSETRAGRWSVWVMYGALFWVASFLFSNASIYRSWVWAVGGLIVAANLAVVAWATTTRKDTLLRKAQELA